MGEKYQFDFDTFYFCSHIWKIETVSFSQFLSIMIFETIFSLYSLYFLSRPLRDRLRHPQVQILIGRVLVQPCTDTHFRRNPRVCSSADGSSSPHFAATSSHAWVLYFQ